MPLSSGNSPSGVKGAASSSAAEAFNIFNHPVLGTPNNDLNNGNGFRHRQQTFTGNTSRELQLGAKVIF